MGLTINATYDTSITSAVNAVQIEGAIQAAIQFFQNSFSNNITINIAFGYGEINGAAISAGNVAQSRVPTGLNASYATVYSSLNGTATSHDDLTSVATLPLTDPTPGAVGSYFMASAELKAVGLRAANDPAIDGYVGLSNAYTFTYDPNNRAVPGAHDAIGAIEHEISEVMGRYGAVATANWSGRYTALDLFRYASPGTRTMVAGPGSFSIDGTNLLQTFNNPLNGGDVADWLPSIQGDSFGSNYSGVASQVTRVDLKTMDVLGYTLSLPTYTAAQFSSIYNAAPSTTYANVTDTAAAISSNFSTLSSLSAPSIGAVYATTLTDPANAIQISSAQLSSGTAFLGTIASNYSLLIAMSANLAYAMSSHVVDLTLTGSGAATITGNASGNVFHVSNSGNDAITGGGGSDSVDYSGLATNGLNANIVAGNGTVAKTAGGTDTLTAIQSIVGTHGTDVFYADAAEKINGGGGFDYLIELVPGATLTYGTNFTNISEVISNTGNNVINAVSDVSQIFLYGSTGNDTLTLGTGGGYAFSGAGANTMNGGANAVNVLIASDPTGTNTMNGGGGTATNYFYVNGAQDTVHGAGAFNVLIEQVANVTLSSIAASGVQEVILGGGTNVADGTGASSFLYLYGGTGNDTLTTGTGGGYLIGEGGTNTLHGGAATNVFIADNAGGIDHMFGGSGSNIFYIDATSDVHGAGSFNTVVELQQNVSLTLGSAQLGSTVNQVNLNGGTNSVDFSAAATTVYLFGGAGNDTLKGGTGNDYVLGGGGANTFKFQLGWGQDTIQDWAAGAGNTIDLTALAASGVHALADLTQNIVGGSDVITSSHTGTNSITLHNFASTLATGSFLFA